MIVNSESIVFTIVYLSCDVVPSVSKECSSYYCIAIWCMPDKSNMKFMTSICYRTIVSYVSS